MIKKTFFRNGYFWISKAMGYKEITLEFETEEEAEEFMKKIKDRDEETIEELEMDSSIKIDDFDIEDYQMLGEWEEDKNGQDNSL